jgi:hypothetical protein
MSIKLTFGEWLKEVIQAHTECHTRPILWDGEYKQLTRFGWVRLWSDEDPEALARAGCVVQWQWKGEPECVSCEGMRGVHAI